MIKVQKHEAVEPEALRVQDLEVGKLYEVVSPDGAAGGVALAYETHEYGNRVAALILQRGPKRMHETNPLPGQIRNGLFRYRLYEGSVTINND